MAQVEIKVARNVPTQVLSTRLLSDPNGFPPRLISVLDYEIALADKMVAWNERRLMRDVHDSWFYLRMGVSPDEKQLLKRLKKPVYSKLVSVEDRFSGSTVQDFYDFLRQRVQKLTDAAVREELQDYLPEEQLQGLSSFLKAEIGKL